MSFDDVRLPTRIELGSRGGPGFLTSVVTLASGHEQRNQEWAVARAKYDIGYAVQTNSDFADVLAFFYARRGKLRGFRFRDRRDYQATDESIGTGDGATATFQLKKTYSAASNPYTRNITRPVNGTLTVKVATVTQTEGVDFTCNYSTGVITFIGSPLPSGAITATFQFDVPVRFDVDDLEIFQPTPALSSAGGIKLVELRE